MTYLGEGLLRTKRIVFTTQEHMTELSARGPVVWVKGVQEKNRLAAQERGVKKCRDAPKRGITQACSL